jgi:hypothetical protein
MQAANLVAVPYYGNVKLSHPDDGKTIGWLVDKITVHVNKIFSKVI